LSACGIEDDNPETAEIPDLLQDCDVDIVVGEEDYQGEPQARIRRVKPSTAPSMGDLAEAADVDDDEEEGDDEGDDGEDEPYTEEDLLEFELTELKEIAKEDFGITIKRGMKQDAIIAAILEAQEPEDEDDDEAEAEDEAEDDDDLFGDDDDEEAEPEPAPTRRRKVRK
jgi:hypothetical protein